MDFSKFKPSDWMKLGGSAGMLIFGLFAWASGGGESGGNAFDFFFTGTIPWLLIVAVGVISILLTTGTIKRGALPWDLILLAAASLGALLVVIRLLIGPKIEYCVGGFGCAEVELDRGFGLFLSAIASVVCAVGCFLGFKESGGNLNDFTDMNKMKSQFGGAGGSTPPPPPGMTPPPPPPPPPPPGGSAPPPPPPRMG